MERVLIVEDHAPLRTALSGVVRGWNVVVLEAGTAAEALSHLDAAPDLLICDVRLADGSAFQVLEAARALSPEPAKIAISGVASPEEAFRLAQVGVREYLAKPFTLDEFSAAVHRVLTEPPDLDPLLRASVGQVPMREIQRHVRKVMVQQALALSRGSRSGAARLLHVSRQAVQQIVRSDDSRCADDQGEVDSPMNDGS